MLNKNENITISPSDLGLKDLEIFYRSCEHMPTDLDLMPESVNKYLRKTAAIGALSLMSLNGISEVRSIGEPQKVHFVLSKLDKDNISKAVVDIISHFVEQSKNEINTIVVNSSIKTRNFTDEEKTEMEIIDAYYKEVRSLYPAPKKFTL